MNTFTHLHISRIVQNTVEKKLGVKLNKVGFMYGNIKPDIVSSLIKIPHYKEDSLDFVTQEINTLMNTPLESLTNCTKEFSERLGVITHYLSDFFCYAHSKEFEGSIIDHYLYEIRLSQFCMAKLNSIRPCEYLKHLDTNTDFENIPTYIDTLYNMYCQEVACYDKDILYSIDICNFVCLSIISSCVCQEKTIFHSNRLNYFY